MAVPAEPSGELPEAAVRRFGEGAFTSGLTVPDFAACLQMGLEPVGFAQGYCVMQWQWYGVSAMGGGGFGYQWGGVRGYSETFNCPHGMISAEHRSWGQNYEQSWMEDAWASGFTTAYERMIDEATSAGAHGVVGVVDASAPLSDMGVVEFKVQGTAVRVVDGSPPADGRPWTTYLAGQRLAKLVEAGYAPVAVTATVASVGRLGQLHHPVPDGGLGLPLRRGHRRCRDRPDRQGPDGGPATSSPSGSVANSVRTRSTGRR